MTSSGVSQKLITHLKKEQKRRTLLATDHITFFFSPERNNSQLKNLQANKKVNT